MSLKSEICKTIVSKNRSVKSTNLLLKKVKIYLKQLVLTSNTYRKLRSQKLPERFYFTLRAHTSFEKNSAGLLLPKFYTGY